MQKIHLVGIRNQLDPVGQTFWYRQRDKVVRVAQRTLKVLGGCHVGGPVLLGADGTEVGQMCVVGHAQVVALADETVHLIGGGVDGGGVVEFHDDCFSR